MTAERFVRGVWISPEILRECLGLPPSVSIDAMEVDNIHHRLVLRLSSSESFYDDGSGDTLSGISHDGMQLPVVRGRFERRVHLELRL